MADLDQIMKALRNAHKAGDTAAAGRLAKMAAAARQAKPDPRAERIAAAKAGTLTVSPESAAAADDLNAQAAKDMQASAFEPSRGGAAVAGFAQGSTFGLADEIHGVMGAINPYDTYEAARDRSRGYVDAARRDHPGYAYGGEIAGAVAVPVGAGAGGASLASRAGRGALVGGLQGAAYGFGSAEGGLQNRLAGAGYAGAGGAAIGAAVPVIGAGISRLAENRLAKRAINNATKGAPSMDDLRAAADRLYRQAENSAPLPRADFATEAQAMLAKATSKGLDPDLTPGAAKLADRVADAAADQNPGIGFRELDILRKKAAVPAGNFSNRTEQAIGSGLADDLDNFVSSIDPQLGQTVSQARALWGQLRRSETVQSAIKAAENTASGFENGMRIEFRKILKDPRKLRGFSELERKAMQQVVKGSPLGNLLRQIGKMGYSTGQQSNGLGAMVAGIGGTALGGPIGGIAAVGTGSVAKLAADRMARGAANRVQGVVQSGGLKALPRLTAVQKTRLDKILLSASRPATEPAGRVLQEQVRGLAAPR